jgi:hypothetical protein
VNVQEIDGQQEGCQQPGRLTEHRSANPVQEHDAGAPEQRDSQPCQQHRRPQEVVVDVGGPHQPKQQDQAVLGLQEVVEQ